VTQAAPQASAAVSPAKPPRNATFTFCYSDDNNAAIDVESSFMLSSITKVNLPNDRIYFKAKLMAAVDEAAATYKETIL